MKTTLAILFLLAFALPVLGQEAAKKTPVPADAAQAEATKLIKEVYGDEYAKAKTSSEKQTLAKKLLDKASESKDDPANQFVLLRLARDIATQANDGQTAYQAINAITETFQVDAAKMKLAVLTKLAAAAEKPAEHKSIATPALNLLNQAVSQDDFTLADEVGNLAVAEARKARDKELIAQAQERVAEVAELAKAYEEVQKAGVTLKTVPDDPEANLVVGKYQCFAKGNWDKGLPMLALGKDEALKALAQQELKGAASSTEQTKLGDGWWNLAEKEEGTTKKQIQARAGYWYQRALPGLSGLMKDKVEKRLAAAIMMKAEVYLSDLKAQEVRVLWDFNGMLYGFNGKRSIHNLWAHPPAERTPSHIQYELDKRFKTLGGAVGISVTVSQHPESPLTFKIVGDGKLLWKSKPMQANGPIQSFHVDVAKIKTLELFVECPGSHVFCHAMWLAPVLSQ